MFLSCPLYSDVGPGQAATSVFHLDQNRSSGIIYLHSCVCVNSVYNSVLCVCVCVRACLTLSLRTALPLGEINARD